MMMTFVTAIALSLKEVEKSSSKSQSTGGNNSTLYPSVASSASSTQVQKNREPRKVQFHVVFLFCMLVLSLVLCACNDNGLELSEKECEMPSTI
jgi:hypothetical protein